jgi:hypothetical protein
MGSRVLDIGIGGLFGGRLFHFDKQSSRGGNGQQYPFISRFFALLSMVK